MSQREPEWPGPEARSCWTVTTSSINDAALRSFGLEGWEPFGVYYAPPPTGQPVLVWRKKVDRNVDG